MHLSHGLPDPLQGLHVPGLELASKGLKRNKPRSKDSHLPITPLILNVIGNAAVQRLERYDQLMLSPTCCLGFFAFLRLGELTLPGGEGTFDSEKHLSPSDISGVNSGSPTCILRIHLKYSKTDQTRAGMHLFVGWTYSALSSSGYVALLVHERFYSWPTVLLERSVTVDKASVCTRGQRATARSRSDASAVTPSALVQPQQRRLTGLVTRPFKC